MTPVTNLQFLINAYDDSQIRFDPAVKRYDVTVPTDCFGALLKLEFAPEFYISIRSDRDAGRFGFESLDPEMGDYIAGTEIPYYEYYGGYIVRLDKREACFDQDLDVLITIDAGSSEHGSDHYEIRLHRDSGAETRALFSEGSFYDEEYEINMPYELYVPTKYNPKKKYPLVVGLHGTGEVQEPVSAILKKMDMATVWAEDSENGENECIVLAPQCTVRYDEEDNWTTLSQFIAGHSNSPFWPMPQLTVLWRLIGHIRDEYKIDSDRMYLTGVSSGAFGALVFATEHPDTFAAVVTACGAANPERIKALKGTPVWLFHSSDDPLIVPSYTLDPTLAAMDKAGVSYKLTRYEKGRVFWQSAHFCWELMYKDKKMRKWLFSQKLGAIKKLKKKAGIPAGDRKSGQAINDEINDIAAKAIANAKDTDKY